MVWFNIHAASHLPHLHRGTALEYLSQMALMLWVQMSDDDKGHSCVIWQSFKEGLQRFQTTCRRANAYDSRPFFLQGFGLVWIPFLGLFAGRLVWLWGLFVVFRCHVRNGRFLLFSN
jgi:hypothetical protein